MPFVEVNSLAELLNFRLCAKELIDLLSVETRPSLGHEVVRLLAAPDLCHYHNAVVLGSRMDTIRLPDDRAPQKVRLQVQLF